MAWAERHVVVVDAAAEELGRAAADRPVDASIALHRALGAARSFLERIFGALVEGRDP